MPIQQDPAILGAIKQRQGARDEITRILNKETKPRQQDITQSTFENVRMSLGQRDKARSTDEVFGGRVNAMVSPQMDIYKVADEAVKAGSEQAKAMMETFGQFADNPEDLASLWAAAEQDPEEITAQNAATFAARKSRELGLKSVKRIQAENQQMFGEARLLAAEMKAVKEAEKGQGAFNSMYGVQAPVASAVPQMPMDTSQMRIIQPRNPNAELLPPPAIEGTQPQPMPEMAPKGGNLISVNDVQVDASRFAPAIREANILTPEKLISRIDTIRTKDKQFINDITQGDEARKVLAEVGYSRNALNELSRQGLSTGKLQNFVGQLVNQPQFEVLSKAGSATAILQRVAGTGAVSNFDAQELKNQVMDPAKNPATIRVVLGAMEAEAKNQLEFADYLDWYVSAFGTKTGANQLWKQFRKENPMIEFDFKAMQPMYLPGFNADWRQWVGGQRVPTSQGQDLKSKYGLE
jgi:hypothetical protein